MNFHRIVLKKTIVGLICASCLATGAAADDLWQNEISFDRGLRKGRPQASGKAYLWIPPGCNSIRGVILCQMTRLEERLTKDPIIRETAAEECLAVVFLKPGFDALFNYVEKAAGEKLESILSELAGVSKHPELNHAPLLTMGHSTAGIFARNIAYWKPERVIGIVHIKSGNLHQHIYGKNRSLAGVPFMAVNGELEEYGPEGGIRPEYGHETQWIMMGQQLQERRRENSNNLMSLVVHPGGNHVSWDRRLSELTALFIRKAARARIPDESGSNPVRCKTVSLESGWLTDADIKHPVRKPAAFADYMGDRGKAYWHLDEELARAVYEYHRRGFASVSPGKQTVIEIERMKCERASIEPFEGAGGSKVVVFDYPDSQASVTVKLDKGSHALRLIVWTRDDQHDATYVQFGNSPELRIHPSRKRALVHCDETVFLDLDQSGEVPIRMRTGEPGVKLDRIVVTSRSLSHGASRKVVPGDSTSTREGVSLEKQSVTPLNMGMGVDGGTEYHDIRYLPETRYGSDNGPRGNIEMTLDVFVPPGEGPCPTVIYVHGGGYGGGTKKVGGTNKQLVHRLLEEGFVVVSLNYMLHPKGIFPQIWWDFHDAVRFLRTHAETYRIDPLRIGSYGLSAGGWLISSAMAGNGDLLRKNNSNAISIEELKKAHWRIRVRNPDEPDNWLRPMKSPAPAWPGVHGGVAAIAQDFDHFLKHAQSYNPYVQKWVGLEYRPKFWESVVANGAEENFEMARLVSDRYKGQKTHVPPFYPQNKREADRALAQTNEGTAPLGELVTDFFRRRLVEECRLPTPEIYPTPRVFAETAEVSMVAPPGTIIYYTIDGSNPTADSTSFQKPFRIDRDTVVKALAVRDGFVSSGVNIAHFVQGPPAPTITGPEQLPPARTGEPYEVVFKADSEDARWLIQGELVPHIPWKKRNMHFPNNMSFDSLTGTWSGTPFKPGRFWVQIWVNSGDGTLASHRDYVWEVTGEKSPASPGR